MIDGVRWASSDDCAFNTNFNAYVNCYGLPRFDVQRFYPTYPDAPHAGFMFTLDVGALLAIGVHPGNHVLKVRVGDQQQTFAELPGPQGIPVFFECAEDRVAAAIGFIDIPVQFDPSRQSDILGCMTSEVDSIASSTTSTALRRSGGGHRGLM